LPTLETAIRSANRARASIYAIDPRAVPGVGSGAAAAGPAEEAQRATLERLAVATDGYAVTGAADLEAGLSRAANDASAYYLIAFQPGEPDERAGGRLRPVEVRVRRPDVVLRARSGIWHPPRYEPSIVLAGLAVGSDPPSELPRRSSPLIRPWFGMARGEAGQTRVTFVWEPAARLPGVRDRGPEPARITLKVVAPDGVARFEGGVRPAVAAGTPASEPAQAVFEAPPGRLRLEMAIEDDTAQVIDTDVREILVGPLGGPVALGSPRVMRARTARAFRALSEDADAVPVVSRTFSRTDRLLIRLPAYAEQGAPAVTAMLASEIGGDMRELPVAPGVRPDLYQIDVALAGLAPGEYAVRIVARGAGTEATERVAFRVIP
jgi:hypothetical protein